MTRAIVVGAGISGIAAAARLVELGYDPLVLESERHLGGRIGVRRHDGTTIDLGGRNFRSVDLRLQAVLSHFGITELVDYHFNSMSVDPSTRVDMRPQTGALNKLVQAVQTARTLGATNALRLEQIRREASASENGHLVGSPYWVALAESTGDPSAAEYFGESVALGVIRPWTLRMMASEPDEVFVANLAPLLGGGEIGVLKRVSGGMGMFLDQVGARLSVRYGHRVERILIDKGQVVGVSGLDPEGRPFTESAEHVVLATAASVAARLLPDRPGLVEVLQTIAYRPVATVVAQYSEAHFPDGLSGLFLPPGHEASHIAKYDGSARVRFSFTGSAARSFLQTATIDDMVERGEALFRKFDGRLGERIWRLGEIFSVGLCGHSRMHHRTVSRIRQEAAAVSGLALTGDYFYGNSLEACCTAARDNVNALLGATG